MSDMTDAQAELDEQGRWGENRDGRAIRRVLDAVRRHDSDLEQARRAIVDLRQRVKALEDARPPA